MIAPLAKFIDWHVLQATAMLWLKSARKYDAVYAKLAEAIEFLNGPNFIPAESKPAELEFKSKIHPGLELVPSRESIGMLVVEKAK